MLSIYDAANTCSYLHVQTMAMVLAKTTSTIFSPGSYWHCIECELILDSRIKSATKSLIKWKIYCVTWRVQVNTRRTIVLLHGIHTIEYQGKK